MSKTKNKYLYPMPTNTVKANLTGSSAVPSDVTLAALKTALGVPNKVQIVQEFPKKMDSTYPYFYYSILGVVFPWYLSVGKLTNAYLNLGTVATGTAPTIKLRKYNGSSWIDLTSTISCPTSANTVYDISANIISNSEIQTGNFLDIQVVSIGSGDAENLQVVTVWEI
jgi:hypothetical protein